MTKRIREPAVGYQASTDAAPAGRVNFSKQDIGAEILPILTSGLYRDSLDALREYIQNAIDAHSTHIEIVIDPDTVVVTDDGNGMTEQQARRAIRLGMSDKNPQEHVGFRGIGIYSGYNLCDTLEVYTKSAEEPVTYRLFFDFARVRRELQIEQERQAQGRPLELYLERLLKDAIYVIPAPPGIIGDHGTKVIMSGLRSEAYLRLNNWEEVTTYLENVVPLPFNPAFRYAERITAWLLKLEYRLVPLTLRMGDREEPLYRPYTDEVFKYGGQHPPQFFDIQDRGLTFGRAWVCVNDARETIKDIKIRGLLIKKFGFSIGDRRYLEPFFGRTVYSRRITGEVIITNPDLIPNAARSDFESNSARQAFLAALPRFIHEVDGWADGIQEQEKGREVLAELSQRLLAITQGLAEAQRDRDRLVLFNAELADIQRRLRPQVRRLKDVEPEAVAKAQFLLADAQEVVKSNLAAQQRRTRSAEQELAAIARRQQETLSVAVQQRAAAEPQNLLALLDAYSLIDSAELRRVLEYVDANLLKANLPPDMYSAGLRDVRDYLEEAGA